MGRFDSSEAATLRTVFEVNFFATVEMIREAIPFLRSGNNSLIVNVGSVLGHFAAPLKSEYCASKFALHGFNDALRAELSEDGIDVLHICPSTTDSDFFDSVVEDNTGRDWKKRGAMSPEVVAQKTIRAMENRRREIVLSAGGKGMVWLDRLFPSVAGYFIRRFGQ